jgi:hypothetical protein
MEVGLSIANIGFRCERSEIDAGSAELKESIRCVVDVMDDKSLSAWWVNRKGTHQPGKQAHVIMRR